jgi:hypothetical protein
LRHSDVFGTRERKYELLNKASVRSTKWASMNPTSPFSLLIPQAQTLFGEYQMVATEFSFPREFWTSSTGPPPRV